MLKNKLLLVGQTPPPIHGQAIANQMLLDYPWKDWELLFLRMEYSDGMEQVGRFQFRKITHLFSLTRRARRLLKENPGMVLFYPPASASWLPFLRDVFFLMRTRKLARGTAFIFHARGLPGFCKGSGFKRWLSQLAYQTPDLCLEVSRETPRAGEVFGARHSAYCPCAAEPVRSEAINSDCEVEGVRSVLFVGSLQEGKGVLELLKTAVELRKLSAENVCFRVAGVWADDDFREECLRFQKQNNLRETVEFIGSIQGARKWDEFERADAFFFPTHYQSEASPIVLMEALGMGLPIVTTRWAGIPDLVEACQAVTLCPIREPELFAKALLELQKGAEISEIAIAFYEKNFTPESYVKRVENSLAESGLLNL